MAARISSLPPRGIALRYNVVRVLGQGGYAVVYEAEDRRLKRSVALKTVLPEHPDRAAALRLTREANVMASISHPNICAVSDAGQLDDGRPFFVMERLEGESLRHLLQRELVVDVEQGIAWMLEVLSALHAVHSAGIVHRDVKPENIFLVRRTTCAPTVKLLDFGCCGPMSTLGEIGLTRESCVVGTAGYMAPEQAAGSRTFHAGIDIFAVALVLLEIVTGERPSARKPKFGVPLSNSRNDLSPALDAVLRRALSPDPLQRYRSTLAFAKELADLGTRPSVRPRAESFTAEVVPRVFAVPARPTWQPGETLPCAHAPTEVADDSAHGGPRQVKARSSAKDTIREDDDSTTDSIRVRARRL